MAAKPPPHLRDLFQTGREFTMEILNLEDFDNPYRIEMWLRKPSAPQYEQALSKARGKQGRKRQLYRDSDSDEYMDLTERTRDLGKEQLVEEILTFEMNDLRTQSYNEALYGDNDEEEPRFGKEGADYFDVLSGLRSRHEEIHKHNEGLAEEDKESLEIKPEEDEEILRLNEYIEKFGELRDERLEKLSGAKRRELNGKTADTLRKDLMKRMIDLEAQLAFYQEFKTWMVFFSCRYPENHKRQYFESVDEILELPEHVQIQLYDAYDKLEQGADNLKNSPSPQLS